MIGRADIEGSKSDVATNAWPPQASYPCGNFSDTSCSKLRRSNPRGSIGPAFAVLIRTENKDQAGFCPFALREVSVLSEPTLGHPRYCFVDVPPQSNSPFSTVHDSGHEIATDSRIAIEHEPPTIAGLDPSNDAAERRAKRGEEREGGRNDARERSLGNVDEIESGTLTRATRTRGSY